MLVRFTEQDLKFEGVRYLHLNHTLDTHLGIDLKLINFNDHPIFRIYEQLFLLLFLLLLL